MAEFGLICADTNCIMAYLSGEDGSDIEFLDKLLRRGAVAVPPVVIAELLSDPALSPEAELVIGSFPVLATGEGYWQRTGRLRARLAAHGYKAGLGDSLVAQICLDYQTPLMTRDKGFGCFSKVAGLKVL
jgi:predicted nucleic acid-binding protein